MNIVYDGTAVGYVVYMLYYVNGCNIPATKSEDIIYERLRKLCMYYFESKANFVLSEIRISQCHEYELTNVHCTYSSMRALNRKLSSDIKKN